MIFCEVSVQASLNTSKCTRFIEATISTSYFVVEMTQKPVLLGRWNIFFNVSNFFDGLHHL